MYVICIYIHI